MRYAKFLILLLPFIYGCATARPSEDNSGILAKLYAGSGGLEGSGPYCDSDPPTGVSEIAIEGTGCFGPCPMYTMIVRSDGTATYIGSRVNARFKGTRHGEIDPSIVEEVARLAVDIGFFDMDDFYSCQTTDSTTIYLSIVRNGARKTIMYYAPDSSGPPRLRFFVDTMMRLEKLVVWQ